MNIKFILASFILAFFLFSCGEKPVAKKESMAQFSDDKEFQNAHERPEKINHDGKGEMITFEVAGEEPGNAYQIKSANGSTAKTLLVIHEWWGLNDHIKEEADRLYEELGDFHVMALDLYDGRVATEPKQAGEFMKSIKPERAKAIIQGAIAHLGSDAKIATVGWCFGGGWSLRSGILAGEQGVASIIYYGMPVESAEEIAPLKADVMMIHPTKDKWINQGVVDNFKTLSKATGKSLVVHQFEADHAFANPSRPNYIEEDANKANQLTLDFIKKRM